MKPREAVDEAVGDYLAAKCTEGRPRWTSGLWSAVMPRLLPHTYIKIKTKTRQAQTPKSAFIMQHLALNADCSLYTLALPLGGVPNTWFARFTDTNHK